MAGAMVTRASVSRLAPVDMGIAAESEAERVIARTILLATGVTNRGVAMPPDLHDAALASGRLRYCPVCDGFEVTDKAVGVVGSGSKGVKEALFLRSYTDRVTLIANEAVHDLSADERGQLADFGIEVLDGPAVDFRSEPDGLSLSTAAGRRTFASIYPALGSDARSGLARALGAEVTDDGCIKVDAHQRTTAPRLYAAGDVVIGLDQISHAMGQAGVAATTIRNDLALEAPLRR